MGRLLTLLIALLAGLLPMGAAAKSLTIGLSQYPSTLHPTIDSMLAKSYVLGLVHRPMMIDGREWELECLICMDIPTFENGGAERVTLEDGREGVKTTYRLHPDVTWGDGTPVTTADVAFTLEMGKDPRSGFVTTESYKRIVDLEIINAKTFSVTGDRITYLYSRQGNFVLLPAHLERPVAEADIDRYSADTLYQTDPTNPGLWFGPYRIESVDPGRAITVVANSTWYGPKPVYDSITLKVVENTAALEANFLSGEIDMIAGELGIPIDQALSLERRAADRAVIRYQPGLIYEHLEANLDNPVLADVRVRRAILKGIDRAAINQRLFGGQQPPADTNINPLDWIHTKDGVRLHPYDPKEAGNLLEAAGWTPGADGIRTNAAGDKLTFTLMTTAGNQSRELIQQVIQAQLREIGIDIRIQNEPPRVLFGETVRKRAFPDLVMFAWISAPESLPRTTLHSDQIPTQENNWTGQNVAGYANPAMDDLLDRIERELAPDARKALWAEFQALYAETLPAMPLYFRANPHVLPPWLEGFKPSGHLAPSTLWVEEWVDRR